MFQDNVAITIQKVNSYGTPYVFVFVGIFGRAEVSIIFTIFKATCLKFIFLRPAFIIIIIICLVIRYIISPIVE